MAIQHGILAERPATSHSNLFQAGQVSEVVRRFYESDEISGQSLWRKDFITVRDDHGKKMTLQTYDADEHNGSFPAFQKKKTEM
ncbi:hypothetical protein PoB_001588900 [Plakobranchus ocellatus]|uniref:Uncharacterized protein n=1 Tax=Plakobranchus ocellatus TaxID=259542 RepID=A0AAV3Z237_9GAST|nr:hypothetical protein PoB_001588900 [Plakobranchus ocellatus]